RDRTVTGVQTCALPISQRVDLGAGPDGGDLADDLVPEHHRQAPVGVALAPPEVDVGAANRRGEHPDRERARFGLADRQLADLQEIGRASCRERAWPRGW